MKSSEVERERLLEAEWESRLRGGLVVWRRPGGRGSWYPQRVAVELQEFLVEEKNGKAPRWAHPGTAEEGGSSMKRDEPGFDAVLEALEASLMGNPHLRGAPIEEVARQLMLDGYLEQEPSLDVVGQAMATVAVEEQAFGPDVPTEDV
jgi:hypothetical protein